MTPIQTELVRALEAMGDKSRFTDSVLAKKLREVAKIEGKNKATISVSDLMAAIEELAECGKFFSVTVTSANDLVIERGECMKEISLENKQRRQRHEKSCSIFTSNDLNQGNAFGKKYKKENNSKRTRRESLDVNGNWE